MRRLPDQLRASCPARLGPGIRSVRCSGATLSVGSQQHSQAGADLMRHHPRQLSLAGYAHDEASLGVSDPRLDSRNPGVITGLITAAAGMIVAVAIRR